jgi:hypothetical protein
MMEIRKMETLEVKFRSWERERERERKRENGSFSFSARSSQQLNKVFCLRLHVFISLFLGEVCRLKAAHPPTGVARWYIFEPKIPIWVNFVGVLQRKMLVYLSSFVIMLWTSGMLCGHLVLLCSFGTFSPFWYVVAIKIWQPFPCPPPNNLGAI